MTSMYVQLNSDVLKWIIERVQSAEGTGPLTEILKSWEQGLKKPTFRQVEEMSRKTRIPFGYFFLMNPPKESDHFAEYRTISSSSLLHPSRDLIDTLDAMKDVQEWMKNHRISEGMDPFLFVGRTSGLSDPSAIAEDIREELCLREEWYLDFHDARESFRGVKLKSSDAGILVMMNGVVGNNTHRPLDVKEFRAFTLVDSHAPLIFINGRDSETGQLFSLLHELAHIWVGEDSLYNDPDGTGKERSGLEQLCNAVAAELIAPAAKFRNRWDQMNGKPIDKVRSLASYFHCSGFVTARRALNLGRIRAEEYHLIISGLETKISQSDRKHSSGGDFYKTLQSRWDRSFILALNESARNGKTLYSEVYHLTGTNGKTFSGLVQEIGG